MRQPGVIVAEAVLEPRPIVGSGILIEIDQPVGERFPHLVYQPVAAEPAEILMDTDKRPGPTPRISQFAAIHQGAVERLHGPGLQAALLRPADAGSQGANRPAKAVIRAHRFLFQPMAVEAEEVAEPPSLRVEGRVHKRGVACAGPPSLRRIESHFFQVHRKQ